MACCRAVLLVAAGVVFACSSDVSSSDVASLAMDDECVSGSEGCALNAIQTKAKATSKPKEEEGFMDATQEDTRFTGDAEDNETLGWAPPPRPRSHKFMATSTRYGTNAHTACGLDSAALVAGTDYLPVASAQAMQNGCCRCNGNGGGNGAASMGCGACGRGRFIRKLPRGYQVWTPASASIFSKEYNIVVADICPKGDNSMWCPGRAGEKNTFGVQNHFDFAIVPPQFDNFYFEFTPGPCSPDIQRRLKRMSKCHLR
eukprot:TRINITY_DN444_c0_g1_i1.p1 TRINITY_DN444_c0_g1~~TRINITY_DN444_c0_g1_i1.p1  ORF type:complete len:258 (-),score=58.14 TRINITY_DN444_c0_g1_i1:260-1033(-)